jgi:hypothetical protein
MATRSRFPSNHRDLPRCRFERRRPRLLRYPTNLQAFCRGYSHIMKQQMPALIIGVVIIAAFIFVPFLRRLLRLVFRLAIFAVGVAIAAAATGIRPLAGAVAFLESPGCPDPPSATSDRRLR